MIARAIKVEEFSPDRTKVLSWWTGKISNAQFASWTNQTERDVRMILDTPYMRGQISGGGRGSKRTRRVSRQARNAVAIVGALRVCGMSIEKAASLLSAVPVVASLPTEIVDFSPSALEFPKTSYGGKVYLGVVEGDKGWLAHDIVPYHVCFRRARPIVRENVLRKLKRGDIAWLPEWREAVAGIPEGWKSLGRKLYMPEIDPGGSYLKGCDLPDTSAATDYELIVTDGKWVWLTSPDIDPRGYQVDFCQWAEMGWERRFKREDIGRSHQLIAVQSDATGNYEPISHSKDCQASADRSWQRAGTRQIVNLSLAVMNMKRAAYWHGVPDGLGSIEDASS